MDRIRNETIRTKNGNEERQIRTAIKTVLATSCELLDGLQGKRRRGRPVNTWKAEIRGQHAKRTPSRIVSVFQSRALVQEKNHVFGLRKSVYSQKTSFNNDIYIGKTNSCLAVTVAAQALG
jgi:hypothetical protein